MNKPRANRDEVRANTLTIPMNKQEKERVQKKANEMGISMSALGRIVLNDFFKTDEFKKYKAVIEFGNPNSIYSFGWQLKMIDNMPFNDDILLWVDMEEAGAYTEVIGNIHDNIELLEK